MILSELLALTVELLALRAWGGATDGVGPSVCLCIDLRCVHPLNDIHIHSH